MSDIENRGGARIEDIEVRTVPLLECVICGLQSCGHSAGLKVVREVPDPSQQVFGTPDATADVDRSLGGNVTHED